MKNKIYHLILLLLFAASGAMAQSVKIHDVIRAPGDIEVQVDMNDFTGPDKMVSSIDLKINYDENLLSFNGITNTQINGNWVANATNGQIIITYNASVGNGYNIDGKLLDLQLSYNGGFTASLDFATGEIADPDLAEIPTTFLNGSVTQSSTSNTVTMVSPTPVLVGTTATIPVKIVGPDNVDAITLKIAYDPDQLVYTGKEDLAITNVVANASGGMLTLNWDGAVMDFTSETTLLNLDFTYNGGGNAPLDFVPGCEITFDGSPFPMNYENAIIEPEVSAAKLTIETKDGTPGTNVTLNIDAADFAATPVGAITLKIGFDAAQLTYTGFTPYQPNSGWNWTVSAGGDVLTLQRIDLGGFQIADGPLVDISFDYHGGGTAPVVFSPGTILETDGFVTIPVDLINGGITPQDHPSKLIIGQVGATTGDWVQVPITAEGFTDDVAAITLKIGFPAGDLVYTGIELVNTNFAGWTGKATSNQVTLNWSKTGGETLADGIIMYLNFNYAGTGAAPVVFNPGVILTDPNGNLIPISMVDGLVGPFIGANLKVFLQGPWNGTDMNTDLLNNGLIPLEQPYNAAPWNYDGGETVNAIPANVVDWVLVELRTGLAASTLEARRAGFLLKDGSVVDLDGTSLLSFYSITQGDYYIVIKHRNHLAVMSATPQTLGVTSSVYDFTDNLGKAYLNGALLHDQMATLSAGVFGMWGGDVNTNGNTRYSGPANDRQVIFNLTGNIGVVVGYLSEDVNLRGQARYNGIQNDRAAIFNFVGSNIVTTHVPN